MPKSARKTAVKFVTVKAYGIFRCSDECPADVVPRDWGPKLADEYARLHYEFATVRQIEITYTVKEQRRGK